MRRLLPPLLVLVGLAAFPASSQGAATRAEYVAQAEPICGLANDDIAHLNRRFRALHKRGDFKKAGKVLSRTGTRLSSSIDQVRAITPPPGDEGTVATWLGLVDKIAVANQRMGRAEAHENFDVRLRIQHQERKIGERAQKQVADWGFHACVGA